MCFTSEYDNFSGNISKWWNAKHATAYPLTLDLKAIFLGCKDTIILCQLVAKQNIHYKRAKD